MTLLAISFTSSKTWWAFFRKSSFRSTSAGSSFGNSPRWPSWNWKKTSLLFLHDKITQIIHLYLTHGQRHDKLTRSTVNYIKKSTGLYKNE